LLTAVAAIVVAMVFGTDALRGLIWPIDAHAMAQTVNGGLYLVTGQETHAISAGTLIEPGQSVRSGSGSSAILRLADGSLIEMAARAELTIAEGRDGVKVRLRRGSVIVTGEKERAGRLYLETPDCEISAAGTMFAVSAVPRGSRVSVIDGKANVLHDGIAKDLSAGQQITTDTAMETVPVRDEIGWSHGAISRLEVLGALFDLREDVRRRIGGKGMRFESDLKSMIPAGAVVVASLPNVSGPLTDAYALFKQRVQESDQLRDWWSQNASPRNRGADEIVKSLTRLGAHLGPEIVLAFPPIGQDEFPIALAGLKDSDSTLTAIQADLKQWKQLAGNRATADAEISIARSPAELKAAAARSETQPVIYIDHNWMAVSSPKQIQRAAEFRANPALNTFSASPLGKRIDQAYADGVGWLLAADLKQMVDRAPQNASAALGWLGMDNADQLIVEQKTGGSNAEYQATLGFSNERHGVAAWVAEPAPMGALDFISPNAYSAAGAVTRDPALILDDVFQFVGAGKAADALETYQREHHLDIRNDLAAPLGNEFLVALDGPILPVPSWRVVIEVNDAARLQSSIENSIASANREAAQGKAASISSDVVDGRTFYRLSLGAGAPEIHYTYWCGYMVLGPQRTLVMESLDAHDSGNSLARSAAFRSKLPEGSDTASAFLYQNIGALAGNLPASGLSQALSKTGPTIVFLNGESDRLVLSGRGLLGMQAPSLAGLANLRGLVDGKPSR
jgi:hypothetical protein